MDKPGDRSRIRQFQLPTVGFQREFRRRGGPQPCTRERKARRTERRGGSYAMCSSFARIVVFADARRNGRQNQTRSMLGGCFDRNMRDRRIVVRVDRVE